jgi:SAM-dependent methyltransferase
MLKTFKCPICKKNHWKPIETYSYSKEDKKKYKYTKYTSALRKFKLIVRALLIAKPRRHIISYRSLSSYQKLRREVIFNVWFKNKTEIELKSIFCTTCGFTCYTPRPEDKDIAEKYEYLNQYKPVQGDQTIHDSYVKKMDRKRAARIYEQCAKYFTNEQLDILDYGGGDGKILIPFQDNHHKCHIIDYYNRPIEGMLKLGDDINNCQIEKKFDVIICSHVLEHVSDISGLIRKLKELLKPDGVIYAEVPQEIWAGLRIEADPVTHINFFTTNSFVNLFLSNGFNILDKHQGIYNYGALYIRAIWIVAQNNKENTASLLPSDTEAMLYPSRLYSIKNIFGLLIVPKLLKLIKR